MSRLSGFLLFFSAIIALGYGEVDIPIQAHTMFPKGFKFGVATAAYQVEGAWDTDGKGPSIWDNLTHSDPSYVMGHTNADVAADSYHHNHDDVALMKSIGFQMYRFSISWPRVMPNGRISNINPLGVAYYMDLIDTLLANGIEPVVTIYHWDLPQALEDIGGWLNPQIAGIYAEYADFVFKTYGSKVKHWITINEPYSIVKGYGARDNAPALNMVGIGDYLSGHNLLRAHAKAYRLYREKYFPTQQGKISMAFCGSSCWPKTQTPEDIAAAERCFQFTFGWFAHPVFFGDYPAVMRQNVDENSQAEGRPSSRLPHFTEEEKKELAGSADYFGMNFYEPYLAEAVTRGASPSKERDSRFIQMVDPSWPGSGLKYVPQGLRHLIQKVMAEYNNPEILITENGCGGPASTEDSGKIVYYEGHAAEIRRAIYEDNAKVFGYIIWSFIDTFEWSGGLTMQMGVVGVDYNDPGRARTPRKSAFWWKYYIAMHNLQ